MSIANIEEELTLEKVSSGDKSSIYTLGLVAAKALKDTSSVVFMTDVLGRIRIMPNEAISAPRPMVEEEDLNRLGEKEAIQALVDEGRTDQYIIEYLARRKSES